MVSSTLIDTHKLYSLPRSLYRRRGEFEDGISDDEVIGDWDSFSLSKATKKQ